jgi:DNA-binding transcriptional MerR regulator
VADTHTTAEVAELTGLTLRQLQTWDESGFVTAKRAKPNGRRYYSRRQVLLLALIEALAASGLSLQRIRRCHLERLTEYQLSTGYLAVGKRGPVLSEARGNNLLIEMAGSAEQWTVLDLAALGKGIG